MTSAAFPRWPKEEAARDHPCPPGRARWGYPGCLRAWMGVMEGMGMLEGLRVMEGMGMLERTQGLQGFLRPAAEKRGRGGGDVLHKSRQPHFPGNVSSAT